MLKSRKARKISPLLGLLIIYVSQSAISRKIENANEIKKFELTQHVFIILPYVYCHLRFKGTGNFSFSSCPLKSQGSDGCFQRNEPAKQFWYFRHYPNFVSWHTTNWIRSGTIVCIWSNLFPKWIIPVTVACPKHKIYWYCNPDKMPTFRFTELG